MQEHRTDVTPSRQRGNFMVVTVLLFTFVSAVVLGSLTLVTERVQDVRVSRNLLAAQLAARSAIQRHVAILADARTMASTSAPWTTFDGLDTNAESGVGGFSQVADSEVLQDLDGNTVAEFDTFVDVAAASPSLRQVTILSYAYVPDKASYQNGDRDAVRSDASTVVDISYQGSAVFDYSYFINHWGWFFGNSIFANGNVRSNGQFDFGGYSSTINGSPRYEGSNGTDLVGYLDDNEDGVTDGSDGGVYSGIGIINQQNIQGMGADPANQHVTGENVPMPNLSDLSLYETKAVDEGGSISVGGTTYVDGVLGDDAGESEHLFLVGTLADPIVLDGPVVVRGSVIISGYVSGQGSIFSGGNVYVPGNILYSNAPDTARPTGNDQATVEAWRAASEDKDLLGLFAREHVVVGDYTHSWWQYYVNQWINDPNNKSEEDAGIDGIQNTIEGPDGVLGTADDDVLEGDGTWTVSYYTQEDADEGLIPAGKSVGDIIPGSGEDIDGDGAYDGPTQMSEFELPAALDPSLWAGNLTQSYSDFSDVSTIYIDRIDSVLYTNHTLGALMINWGDDIQINGSIVSRNESIIYGADSIQMNHDERLSGRGIAGTGMETPIAWDPLQFGVWEYDRALPQGIAGYPDAIASYYTGSGVN